MKKLLISLASVGFLFAGSIDLKVDNKPLYRVLPTHSGDLSFYGVVKKVIPSVVNISTEKIVKTSIPKQFQDFFNDPFFKQFFGPFKPFNDVPKEQKEYALGSGVILSKDGYIITNYHVVKGATKIIVKTNDGRKFKAKLIGKDEDTDLAVIKIKADNLKPITIADSSKIKIGDIVLAVGNPFGIGESVTQGIVSGLNRNSIGLASYENFIQTDASINPGNSGGALVDIRGRLIGINTAILSKSGGNNGIGFAIPSNMVKFVATSLIQNGVVKRGYLGVMISNIDPSKSKLYGIDYGVLINKVYPNTAASEAGLKPGDIIVEVNGEKVKDSAALRNKIAFAGANAEVNLKIYRNGKFIVVKTKLKSFKPKIAKIDNIKLLKGAVLKSQRGHVVIDKVEINSYAYSIGLRSGDEILKIKTIKTQKWVKIHSIDQVKSLLDGLDIGDALIEIKRGDSIFIIQL